MTMDHTHDSIRTVAEAALTAGERLYWVGRPNPLRSAKSNLSRPLFGLFWTAIVFFMFTRASSLNSGFGTANSFSMIFRLMLFAFLLIGVGMVFSPIWNYFKARYTVYAITDERALIIKRFPKQTVQSYSVRNMEKVERHGSEGEGDIIFGREIVTITNRSRNKQGSVSISFGEGQTNVELGDPGQTRTVHVPIGFFGIAQPREAEGVLLDVLRRAGERSEP